MADLRPAPYDLWDAHVHPLVALNEPDKDLPHALGTAFIVHNVVLCCWHQVAAAIEQGVQPGLAANDPAGGHPFVPLNFRRPTRQDVAVAVLPDGLTDAGEVYLLPEHPAEGTDLFSYGYPMPESGEKIDASGARSTIVVSRRLLRGYVVRMVADLDFHPHPKTLGIEADIMAPPGQSGAPVLANGLGNGRGVLGMMQGTSDTTEAGEAAVQFARIYPASTLLSAIDALGAEQ